MLTSNPINPISTGQVISGTFTLSANYQGATSGSVNVGCTYTIQDGIAQVTVNGFSLGTPSSALVPIVLSGLPTFLLPTSLTNAQSSIYANVATYNQGGANYGAYVEVWEIGSTYSGQIFYAPFNPGFSTTTGVTVRPQTFSYPLIAP